MDVDAIPRPVVATESNYPDGHIVPSHHHLRSQLLYGVTGVVTVTTPDITWVMPPQRGIWIPAGTVHAVRMLGPVKKLNLYIEPDAIVGMPDCCQVLGIPHLVRTLLAEAVMVAPEYNLDGRAAALMALVLHEMPRLSPLPLSLALPRDEMLAARCRGFLLQPTVRDTIDQWSRSLSVSRRTFTRWFRVQTGSSFVEWRQQACLGSGPTNCLPRLDAG